MSLEGAKLICLSADDNGKFETIPAKGKTFKFGYYIDCDVVLEHPNAMGLQCIINCDAFGRVTIENRCSDQPITLDGKTLVKMRPLLHNTEICIFDKKYLWQFDGNPQPKGFYMEDINDFTTPAKQMTKPQQPPNSEPARKWRRPMHTRLTIHSFAYCIKAGESPQDVEATTDENKPLNTHERLIDADIVPNKRLSSSPSSPPSDNTPDFIDLNTPKINQKPSSQKDKTLNFCRLSETVITSYSPRETGIRQEKSFAVVQSPLAAASKSIVTNVSLGPFHHTASPQTMQNYRPSMHLIDLITPKKLKPPSSSASRTLLKSTLKKNLPKGTSPQTPHKSTKIMDISTPGSSDSVYSVPSTDDESIIVLSDDGSGSPSPIAKTPPRARTPQSLMKRAILSSAKKAAVAKKLLNFSRHKQTPDTKNPTAVRFQSQSTPQRKSFGRFPSSAESLSAGKPRKSLITSTPFRQRADIVSSSSSRRSLSVNSQSPHIGSTKKESRNSLMLKQALSMTPIKSSMTQKRMSMSCMNNENKSRKSVSFLQDIEKEEKSNINEVVDPEVERQLNHTFSIEEEDKTNCLLDQAASSHCKDTTFSPVKEKVESITKPESVPLDGLNSSTNTDSLGVTPLEKRSDSEDQTSTRCTNSLSIISQVENISGNQRQIDTEILEELTINKNEDPQTPRGEQLDATDYDFDGVDEIFKTPKAKNIMILSSPKSISLQKPTSDSVELIHSTEFDLSANLDDLFQTPQSELLTRRVHADVTPASASAIETLSPEEAFDMLVGRPIIKKSYARKTPPKKTQLSAIKITSDASLPKTDIEEWIDSVNDLLEDETEMSYLSTRTMNEVSRDPLMMQSIAGSSNVKVKSIKTPRDEFEMTLREVDNEEVNTSKQTVQKDPLETTVPRSLSPNISGIGLLDHTSESVFSETLAVSDDSSLKETERTIKSSDDHDAKNITVNQEQLNISKEEKARREIEEAFKNFEKQRKTLDEKRLASTPEAKKPISKITKRRTMGNQLSLDPLFDPKLIKALQSDHKNDLNADNSDELSDSESTVGSVSEVKFNVKGAKTQLVLEQVSEVKSDLRVAKFERELEMAFEKFEEKPEFSKQRAAKTPEYQKAVMKDHRKTLGNAIVSEVTLDFDAARAERELELAFENFEDEPELSEERAAKTPEPKKTTSKDHRRTLGSALVSEVKLDLQAAKAERELELAFENFEEEPEFSEERAAKTPEPKKTTSKDHRRTLGSALVSEVKLDLQAAKAERELELAFENFEEEPEFSKERAAKTPEPKKTTSKDHRRTLGSALVSEVKLDLQAAKAERELELAFENFEEEPEFLEERAAKTPEPKKTTSKDHRRTLGSALVSEVKLDLQAAKAERELELAFENFEEEPEFSKERAAKTPEPKKTTSKDHRRTLGSALVSEVKLDLQAAKAARELELAFENFEEKPEFSEERAVKTPEPKKAISKDHRRTLGSALVSEVKLDLKAAKAERELELAFENFEEEPEFSEERAAKTPEPKKTTSKDHRRTLGSALVSIVKLDLQAAKTERELELAFENFEEEPEFSEERAAKTPEPKKTNSKDHRRTLGSALVSEVKLDLQAAKTERELELAFENFEEEPEFSEERAPKTPEPKKSTSKDHRRTLGSALVSEVKLDLQAAKAERELELAFENFEEEPEFLEERAAKTPEPKKTTSKDHRRTLGSALVSEVKLDLQAAKAERELELAFENFEKEPEFSEERAVKTPEPKKATSKDHRRTLGSALVSEVKLDLQAAKAERELELAFENFEEKPEFSEERAVKTPEPKKAISKDHRRTLGSALVSEVKLDLQAAKAQRELELAFENFEEEPEFSEERAAKTPEPKKTTSKDHRRTLGSALVSVVKLDLQAAKAERELELAFENFEEEPEFSEERAAKTPEPKKTTSKDHRRTLGSALVSEMKLDLQAAKAERELELAFENFEEEPEFSEERAAKTPEPKKTTSKDHRRTLGSALVSEVKLDLQAAKAERELELAFENFEEEPEFSEERAAKTPEPKKTTSKDHRRTLGSALVSEMKLDLQAAKAERELELAFENFEEEPEFSEERAAKTPEPKKTTSKDHRRTLGSALVSEVKLDLQAAKAERELELAFENFEEEPEFSEERAAKTPEPKKTTSKDHRRTLGSALVSEVKLDLQAAKAERELELAFENFEEEPEFSEERAAKTPEPKKTTAKDHRRTLGSALVSEVKLDLQAAKAERELELAFENFEEEPEFSEKRAAKTPEPKKTTSKDHRRTLGSALVSEVKLDLQAAKAERELELAFENFEEEPEFSEERAVKTPEPKKTTLKDHRRTLGSALVSEVKLDLQAAKAERELELAFEKFEEEPEFAEERAVKTPEPKKTTLKDHRRTLGSALVSEVKLDLQAAKAERELELAFENFEEEPEFAEERAVKTPEPKKTTLKDHRRTLGSALVSEVKLDLQAAKAERELELAFENFEEEPEFSEERAAKTPEPKKTTSKDHRRTLGSALVSEVKLDIQAAKAARELELAFENFEEEPEFSEERAAKTPEPKKTTSKDHRRTLGSALVSEVKLDLQAAKTERELELAFENFEEEPEFSEERAAKTPEPKKTTSKDHRRTLGSALVSEVKLDLRAAKAERELELHPETSEEEPNSKNENSTSVQFLTKKQSGTEEDEISGSHSVIPDLEKEVSGEDIDKLESNKATPLRRTRKKATESIDDVKSNVTPIRRTRQNSVDSLIGDAKKPTCSNSEDEPIKTNTLRLNSSDVDTTDDETHTKSQNPRSTRIRKKSAKISEQSNKETDNAHILEPIVEEKNTEPKRENKDVELKSLLSLKAEADEITSLSPAQNSRYRGRKVQLNVVLVESKDTNIVVSEEESSKQVGPMKNYIEKLEDNNTKEECHDQVIIDNDGGESIPSTPLPLSSRERRPSKPLVPALRRTRKGSAQQDIEAKNERVETPIEKIDAQLTIDKLNEKEANHEDVIPSTPVRALRRTRKASIQQDVEVQNADRLEPLVEEIDAQPTIDKHNESLKEVDREDIVASTSARGLRRTRKGSVQQDIQNVDEINKIKSSTISNLKEEIEKVMINNETSDQQDVVDKVVTLDDKTDALSKIEERNEKSLQEVDPESIVPSTPVRALRRTRKASIQQDVEVKKEKIDVQCTIDKRNEKEADHEDVVPSTPVRALRRTRKASIQQDVEKIDAQPTIGKRTESVKEVDREDIVASRSVRGLRKTRKGSVQQDIKVENVVRVKTVDDKSNASSEIEENKDVSPKKADIGNIIPSISVPALRKTRKGSVQQDIKAQNVETNVNNDNVQPSSHQAKEVDSEDTIASTPIHKQTRRRQPINQKISKTTKDESTSFEQAKSENMNSKVCEIDDKNQNKRSNKEETETETESLFGEKVCTEEDCSSYSVSPTEKEISDFVPCVSKVEIQSEQTTANLIGKDCHNEDGKHLEDPSDEVLESQEIENKNESSVESNIAKRRGHGAAIIGENVVRVGNRGRKRPGEQILEGLQQETKHQEEKIKVAENAEPQTVPVPGKKLNREVDIKVEPELLAPSVTSPMTVLATDCINETQSVEDDCSDLDKIAECDLVIVSSLESEKINESPTKNNTVSKTRGRKAAALKTENPVPVGKRGRKRAMEKVSETHQETANQIEEVKSHVEEIAKIADIELQMTPVPSRKRGRRADVKIEIPSPEPIAPSPTKVHAIDEDDDVEDPSSQVHKSQNIENRIEEKNVTSKTRGRKAAVKEENLTAGKRGRKRTTEQTSEAHELQGTEHLKEEIKSHVEESRLDSANQVETDGLETENNLLSKARGTRQALKSEKVVPTAKRGRKRVLEQKTTDPEEAKNNVDECQLDSTNRNEDDKNTDVEKLKSAAPSIKRGRKAALEKESAASTQIIETPVRRGRPKKIVETPISKSEKVFNPDDANNENEDLGEIRSNETEEVLMKLESSNNRRLKRAPNRSATETSTPVRRGVRENIAETASAVEESPKLEITNSKTEVQDEKDKSVNLSPKPSKTRGRKVVSEEQTVESSSRRGGRTKVVQDNVTESDVVPKSRGRKPTKKIDVVEASKEIKNVTDEDKTTSQIVPNPVTSYSPSSESSPSIKSKTQKRSLTLQDTAEKDTDKSLIKTEIESLNESSTKDVDNHENFPTTKRIRRAPAKLTEFIVSKSIQKVKGERLNLKTEDSDIEVHNSSTPKTSAQTPVANSECVEPTQNEVSTPLRKRGRKEIVEKVNQKESDPPRKVGRQTKANSKPDVTSIQDLQNDKNDPSSDLVSEEDKSEEKPQQKTNRRARVLSGASSPSQSVSKEQQNQTDTQTQKKSTRGRGKAASKNNAEVETTSHPEEEELPSATKPKSTRGRKAAPKAEIVQQEDEDSNKVDSKPRRGRKAVTAELDVKSPIATELSPVIVKKTTRGRKAASKNTVTESNVQNLKLDEQPKKTTQPDKDQDEETKLALKRRNLETLTSDDQQDTPSKRTRRKPNKLLCD
ncbi:titin [Episyrphus balteatus]|uniref:titin n=1 Tax=Episyrphus balteatus TaxID=286459 RepID=UPI0024855D8B|nr:titin [Episyrphus balteatus]